MCLLEALESRTLLADGGGSFASVSFSFEGPGPSFRQSITIQFSLPLAGNPTSDDFQIIDLTTHKRLDTILFFTESDDAKTIVVTPETQNSFPDGDYRLILDKTKFPNAAAPGSFDTFFDFFTLTGDLNRDRAVSINDFIQLASNFGKSNPTWSDGDMNYDGQVSITDFMLLNQNFGKSFAPPANLLRINAGGSAFTDSAARTFEPSSDFVRGIPEQTPYDIPYFDDDTLFNTYMEEGDFSFSRPVPNGNYTLFLNFAEPIFDQIGLRVFDVFANQKLILDDFDIMQRAGFRTPITEAFSITITNNSLDLAFQAVRGNAIVSSITLLPNDTPAPVKPYSLVDCAPDNFLISQSALNLRTIGQSLFLYANDNKGHYPADIPTLFAGAGDWFSAFFNPRTSTRLPRGQLSYYEQIALVNTLNDDYISLFAGKNGNSPAELPIAYENPDRTPGPISILFNDGRVGTFDRATAAGILGIAISEPSDPPPPRDFAQCAFDPKIPTSANNLRRLAHALLNYANDNRNTYPIDLGTLYKSDPPNLRITDFLNPRNAHKAPPPNMTVDQTAAWITANSDYTYFGRRMNGNSPPAWVLLAERPDEFTDGVNLLFNDGTVEFREPRWARESINLTDAQAPPPRPATAPLSTTMSTLASPTTDPIPSKPHRHHLRHSFQF